MLLGEYLTTLSDFEQSIACHCLRKVRHSKSVQSYLDSVEQDMQQQLSPEFEDGTSAIGLGLKIDWGAIDADWNEVLGVCDREKLTLKSWILKWTGLDVRLIAYLLHLDLPRSINTEQRKSLGKAIVVAALLNNCPRFAI